MEGGEGGITRGSGGKRPVFATDSYRQEHGLPPRSERGGDRADSSRRSLFDTSTTGKTENVVTERRRANDAEKARDLYKDQFEVAFKKATEAELRAQQAEEALRNVSRGGEADNRKISELTRRAETAERMLGESQRHVQGLQQENMRLRAQAAAKSSEGAPPTSDPDLQTLGIDSRIFNGLNGVQKEIIVRNMLKGLANVYHPDKGGDSLRLGKINAAADRLKERFSRET